MKDNNNPETKKLVLELFSGTYKYYAKYRPGIPKEVINIIVKHFDLKPSDRVLDIGCGTGQVALAIEGRCGEMACLDPDLQMLKRAKKATRHLKMKLIWLNCAAEDLGKIKKKLGTFKVATSSRAFHRMNQEQVLKDLEGLIEKDGGVAIFGDRVIWNGDKKWQQTVERIIREYLKGHTGRKKPIEPEERWENILAHSVFKFIKTHDVPIVRNWDVESIIGYIFSTAFAAPPLFGNQLDSFKEEVKSTLLSINPKGVFQENAVWSIVLGSKKPRE
jgi:ubiquinone/menaquinone biosynthesis C-methylase UbiE